MRATASREPFLGIDFGTTTSLVAWGRPVGDPRGVEPTVLPVPQDGLEAPADCLPTLLYFPRAGRVVVGQAAREQLGLRPDRVVRRLKQVLGRVARIRVAGQDYDPVGLAAAVLRRLRRAAEAHLGQRIRRGVITVPASFDARRRRALLEAAAEAGFSIAAHTLLDEPVAALAAWLHHQTAQPATRRLIDFAAARTLLLLDVGGGTSDACVARTRPDGAAVSVELLSLSRFTPVGGDDFDALVARSLLAAFGERSGLDLGALPPADRLLLEHRMILTAERVKREVAAAPEDGTEPEARVRQMFLHGPHHLVERIDRRRYADLVAPLLADPRPRAPDGPPSVLDAPWDALRKAGCSPAELDLVLLAGGMALVPAVREAVRESLGVAPVVVPAPVEAIVAGAVVQHFAACRGLPGLRTAAPIVAESIGVHTAGGGFRRLIGAGTPLPARVVERRGFAVPPGAGRYVRIPIGEGDEGRPDRERLLVTLALRFPRRVPAGEPIVLEAAIDANKTLTVRGHLEREPSLAAEASLRVGGETTDEHG
jgi:molecular chaperone DnaK